MFWSKIWFFLVAVAAVIGVGVAVTMPRPAERAALESEDTRLDQAMESVRLLLMLQARGHVDTALKYARHEIYVELKKIKDDEAGASSVARELHESARVTLDSILAKTQGAKPQTIIALDAWGRVVARAGEGDKEWGDDLSGYFLVRDALRGYMRDDLWLVGGKLYRVAAAPVVAQPEEGPESYVGALVVGYALDEATARNLAVVASSRDCGKSEGEGRAAASAEVCDTHVAFFANGETVANSGPTTLGASIKPELARLATSAAAAGSIGPFEVTGEAATYRVVARRLPGEAGAQDGFYAVYAERPRGVGIAAMLGRVVKDDLRLSSFPWFLLGGGFVLALGIGLLLMWLESDRPMKRLLREALAIGKGEKKTFAEDQHHGKHGSIARSVNLALDKLAREKSTRRELGALYTTDDSTAAEPVGARPLPPAGPLGAPVTPFTPPPKSDFSLDSGGSAQSSNSFDYALDSAPPPVPPPAKPVPRPPDPAMAAATAVHVAEGRPTPRLAPARVAPIGRPAPLPPPVPLSAVEEELHDTEEAQLISNPPGGGSSLGISVSGLPDTLPSEGSLFPRSTPGSEGEEDAYFRIVYEDFMELKRKCGENTDSLTYDKFLVKLRQNRDQLIAKYACKAVKFQVYVKDGKAALKATPVKG